MYWIYKWKPNTKQTSRMWKLCWLHNRKVGLQQPQHLMMSERVHRNAADSNHDTNYETNETVFHLRLSLSVFLCMCGQTCATAHLIPPAASLKVRLVLFNERRPLVNKQVTPETGGGRETGKHPHQRSGVLFVLLQGCLFILKWQSTNFICQSHFTSHVSGC